MSAYLSADILPSLLLYVGVYYIFFNKDWSLILPLAAIILVHELGHFIAMKMLGYRDVGIIFNN